MHRRVRLLYLEFMYLLPQLDGFYTPRGANTAASASTRTRPSAPRPFFLRVAEHHPVCAPLRAAGAIEFQTPSHEFSNSGGGVSSESPVVVFKLLKNEEMALLDTHMPLHWRTDRGRTGVVRAPDAHAPSAEAEYRAHVQRLFYANALVTRESAEWKRCLARGRYELRGIQNVLHVRKYRALKKRYGWASQLSRTELEAVWAGDIGQVEQALLGLSNKDIYGYANDEDEEEEEDEKDKEEKAKIVEQPVKT